jgi:hypothetical protein
MIADPLAVVALESASISDSTDNFPLSLVDLQLGRTVRSAKAVPESTRFPEGDYTMNISHSESKENPSQITDRAAVRLECRKTLLTGLPSTAQVTLTVSSPRNGWTPADVIRLAKALLGTVSSNGDQTAGFGVLTRVIEGEP